MRLSVPALLGVLLLCLGSPSGPARAQSEPGVTETEIVLGQTMPYSGPLSAFSTFGRAMGAYFDSVNAAGGVGGRKLRLISYDDGYSPPKTVDQTRRLVEQNKVFAIVGTLGTAPNLAIRKYLNAARVPQAYVTGGFASEPTQYPWTLSWLPTYAVEGAIYGRHLAAAQPNARIGVLYQQDDYGRNYLKGLIDGLGPQGDKRVVSLPYQVTDATIDSQLVNLKNANVDALFLASTHKFTSMALRRLHELGWSPLTIVPSVSTSIVGVFKPAGLENAKGVISAHLWKDPADPAWATDPDTTRWREWMQTYFPGGDLAQRENVSGYIVGQLVTEALKRCGADLTRANFLQAVTTLDGFVPAMLLPGVAPQTRKDDYVVFRQMRLMRFDGASWCPMT